MTKHPLHPFAGCERCDNIAKKGERFCGACESLLTRQEEARHLLLQLVEGDRQQRDNAATELAKLVVPT